MILLAGAVLDVGLLGGLPGPVDGGLLVLALLDGDGVDGLLGGAAGTA